MTDSTQNDEQPETERLGLKMKDMPPDEMPREKLREKGPGALSDSELLALLLGSGTSRLNVKDLASGLLHDFEGLEAMCRASVPRMMQVNGIGLAKASQLSAAFEISRRLRRPTGSATGDGGGSKLGYGANMSKPQVIADMMQPLLMDLPQEELWVLHLSKRRHFRGKERVYTGSVDQIDIQPFVVISGVVERREPCFAVVHNHPSGDPEPSSSDIRTTQRLVRAAKELGVEMVDHVVVGRHGFVSLRQSRLVEFG